LFIALLFLAASIVGADSRPWKPNQESLARDYAFILDQRAKNELVMLWWVVPEQFPEQQAVARDLLSKYVILGAVHARADAAGTFSFDETDTLQVTDAEGNQMVAISNDAMPPAISGVLAAMQAGLAQAAGPFGRGIRWFAYKAGSVHSCEKGRLSVQFAGETYIYDTPIPGCPKT
jgi:hypothetical protein